MHGNEIWIKRNRFLSWIEAEKAIDMTVFADMDSGKVLFTVKGKDSGTIKAFQEELPREKISMDGNTIAWILFCFRNIKSL